MKKIFLYGMALIGLSSLVSCEKELMDYEGVEGVYFAVRHGNKFLESTWPYQPGSDVNFVQYEEDAITYPVQVMITGPVKDYDRPFRVEVNPDSTTAVEGLHYEALPSEVIIPAGAVSATVPVHLKRATDLQETVQTLGLRLLPNEYFGLSFPEWDAIPSFTSGIVVPEFDASLHTLRINDFMVAPSQWSGSVDANNKESGPLGQFTRKKFELIVELFRVTYADFSSIETMPQVRMVLISGKLAEYLVERKDAGEPVLEDDGRLMWAGSVPWTSYVGVPWVPGS